MTQRAYLGMLTPSSNTVLEPLTSAMVAALPGVTAHFSRFPVTEISLQDGSIGQFDDAKIIEAAMLLAHARVDVIAWNGTSGGWLGLEADEQLCRRIAGATGIPATTSVLALVEIMRMTGVRDFALVTPYLDGVQARITANFGRAGFNCVAEEHAGLCDNYSFSGVTERQISEMVDRVAQRRPQAITTFCTNMAAARLVPALEAKHGIPVYDTVSTALWKALRLAGVDTRLLRGWGRLFTDVV